MSPNAPINSEAMRAGDIFTHEQVNEWIGGNWQKGIRYSGNFPEIRRVGIVLSLASPYADGSARGSIRYVGEGLSGNQVLTYGNRVLAYFYMIKRSVSVFTQLEDGGYRYGGEHIVANALTAIEPGSDGVLRSVFIFELEPKGR